MENGQLSFIGTQSHNFSETMASFSNLIAKNADDGIEATKLDYITVESVDKALVSSHGLSRSLLYWMRQKKGWMVLGFNSFEDYCNEKFGFSRQHINRIADAYMIQNIVEPSCQKEIKESVLRALKDVPHDVKIQIWDELKLKTDGKSGKITAKMVDEQVAAYKRENEQLQKKLLEVESDMQARFDELQDKQSSLINDNEKIISERVSAVSERYELANKNLSESLVKEQNQKTKLEKQIKALKTNSTADNYAEIENAESRLAEVEKDIEAKQKQLEQFNARLESDYDDSHVNQNIITICQEFREHIALSISELAHLKNVNQTVYEKTNSEIYGTADLLEEFAKKLRMFATDYADFSMSSTTIQ